jgi:hypothetical protein
MPTKGAIVLKRMSHQQSGTSAQASNIMVIIQ